jgi:hypothetical protein
LENPEGYEKFVALLFGDWINDGIGGSFGAGYANANRKSDR